MHTYPNVSEELFGFFYCRFNLELIVYRDWVCLQILSQVVSVYQYSSLFIEFMFNSIYFRDYLTMTICSLGHNIRQCQCVHLIVFVGIQFRDCRDILSIMSIPQKRTWMYDRLIRHRHVKPEFERKLQEFLNNANVRDEYRNNNNTMRTSPSSI